jgi:hypothetical protein
MSLGDTFRCDICGVTAPVDDKHRVSVLIYNKHNINTDMYQPRLNVCSKCLPALETRIERVISDLKTAKAKERKHLK